MGLANTKLVKVGTLQTNPNASGHTVMQLVQSAAPLADPGPWDGKDPSWHSRRAAYAQSIQVTQKFSQDWE
jgi:hypothetical protein